MSSADQAASGCSPRLGAAVLAAGSSRRYGTNKLLDDFEGRPLFEWVLGALPTDLFARVVVVTAYEAVAKSAVQHGFVPVFNAAPQNGQAHSVRLAMRELSDLDGCMFLVCDQPYMSTASLRRLAQSFDETGGIHALQFGGRRGNPVLFGSAYFAELESLGRGEKGSAVIRRHMDALQYTSAECAAELMDIDSKLDRQALDGVKNFFFTGARRAGKSTLLERAVKRHGIRAAGIVTVPYFVGGAYTGYMLRALGDAVPAQLNNKPISVYVPPDSCIAIPQTFSVFGTQYLGAIREASAPLILLDELGRLEAPAADFCRSVLALLDAPRPVVGVLKDEDIPWLDAIRSRPDTRVVRVLKDHRNEAKRELDRFLSANGLLNDGV